MLCVDKALGQFSDADPDMDALRAGSARAPPGCLPRRAAQADGARAARLVELAEKTEHDWLQDAPERYRELLGDDGLAALDAILTRKLAAMPPDSRLALSHTGLTLRAMSESLARALGDIDRLVRELALDLDDAGALRAHRARAGRGAAPRGCARVAAARRRRARRVRRCAARGARDRLPARRSPRGCRSRSCAPSSCGLRARKLTAELLAAAGEDRDAERDLGARAC